MSRPRQSAPWGGGRRRRPWVSRGCGGALLIAALCLTPWSSASARPAEGSAAEPLAAGRSFEDILGQRVSWTMPPTRMVSLSPNVTEILFALGCDARTIVGVTRFCSYPPEARTIPSVGGVVDPSLEVVLALEPDLVLATRGNSLEFMASLIRLERPVYAVETRGDLAQILEVIGEIGAVIGREGEARVLIERLDERRRGVAQRMEGLDAESRPRVYYGELEGTLWTAGPGSFLHDLISAAGGTNVAAEAPAAWCPLSLEEIVARDPQVYLGSFTGEGTATEREAQAEWVRNFLASHEIWSRTSLGRAPRVFLVHEDRLQRPGPRIFDVLEEFARFLHPDRWD